jgi:hypothetical protein
MLDMSKKSEDKVTNGGSMTTKRVLLLGGAALLLAGCADATAPGTQMRRGGVSASVQDSTRTGGTRLAPTTTTMESTSFETCRNYQVVAGRTDSTCVEEIQY